MEGGGRIVRGGVVRWGNEVVCGSEWREVQRGQEGDGVSAVHGNDVTAGEVKLLSGGVSGAVHRRAVYVLYSTPER